MLRLGNLVMNSPPLPPHRTPGRLPDGVGGRTGTAWAVWTV